MHFVEAKSTFLMYARIKNLSKFNSKNSDLASTKCSSTSIYTVKTQVFCETLRKNQLFLHRKSITKCILPRRNQYFDNFGIIYDVYKSIKNRSKIGPKINQKSTPLPRARKRGPLERNRCFWKIRQPPPERRWRAYSLSGPLPCMIINEW